jgi:hypothetical protein
MIADQHATAGATGSAQLRVRDTDARFSSSPRKGGGDSAQIDVEMLAFRLAGP